MIGVNQLIFEALQNWVEQRKDAQLDDEFRAMTSDVDYITETLAIEEDFILSDREVAMSSFSKD